MIPVTCCGCDQPMLSQGHKVEGFVEHNAHGHCKTCYKRLHWKSRRGGIDEIAVERAVTTSFDPPARLNQAELREVVRILTGRGWSSSEIGERLNCTSRTVQRARARLAA